MENTKGFLNLQTTESRQVLVDSDAEDWFVPQATPRNKMDDQQSKDDGGDSNGNLMLSNNEETTGNLLCKDLTAKDDVTANTHDKNGNTSDEINPKPGTSSDEVQDIVVPYSNKSIQKRKSNRKIASTPIVDDFMSKPLTRNKSKITGVTPIMVQDALDKLLKQSNLKLQGSDTTDLDDCDVGEEDQCVDGSVSSFPIPDVEFVSYLSEAGDAVEPKNYKEAISSPDADKWLKAIADEYGMLLARGTWVLEDLPPGRKPIGSKWVFKIKRNPVGQIEKFKARLVAQGFSQRKGVDFEETYSPVAGLATIRLLMAWAVQHGMYIDQFDFESAYIHGDADAVIFMRQPEGHEVPGQENKVCRIVRSLYGLKQSGRCWYNKLDAGLRRQGLVRSGADACVYILRVNQHIGLLPVYVDDSPAISSSPEMRKYLQRVLSAEFNIRYLGPINVLLGIQFTRFTNGHLQLSQRQYIVNLLTKYKMQDCNPAKTPIEVGHNLRKNSGMTQEEQEEMSRVPYRQLIGALSYLAHATRFDISHAVNVLAQFGADPRPEHWKAALRVLRYLKGTLDRNLVYGNTGDDLHLYSDASLGSSCDDRRSYTGVAVFYGQSLVQWHATKQKAVSLSTMEAEYRAIGQATKDALWMRCLLSEIGDPSPPTKIFTDSTAAIAHAVSRIENSRSKYIDITCHFVRERVENKEIRLVHVPTKFNLADIFTKPLLGPRFTFLFGKMATPGRTIATLTNVSIAGEFVGLARCQDEDPWSRIYLPSGF